jgi:serine/threonine protein kinase
MQIKIGDLGIAIVVKENNETKTGGTINYLAPELLNGFFFSYKSDVW